VTKTHSGKTQPNKSWLYAVLICALLSGCGGGGGGGSNRPAPAAPPAIPPPAASSDFDQGIFSSPVLYKDLCQVPRGSGFTDAQGSREDENDWLRAWSHELYLWYDEIVDADPRLSSTPEYFDLMKTFALTPSGAPKDQFHFTFDTEAWEQLSQSGVAAGYGAEFVLLSSTPPRSVVVAYVEQGSPAATAGLVRGTRVFAVDGVDLINAASQTAVDTLNAGLFPGAVGEQHELVIEDPDGTNRRTVSLTAVEITQNPVPTTGVFATSQGPAGYLVFNSHIATAESRLVSEISALEAAGVTNLIVDLRYNGGGFLDIANQLAYMIAGPAAAAGQIFGEIQFNDQHPSTNPVTGQPLAAESFHTTTQGFSLVAGTPLPSLNLTRVYVLSGPETCSASEAIINGLQGIDIEVILIGEPTCGKPYGFYPTDNCGTTYFTIQFRGVNAKGFGDYPDGFLPTANPLQMYELKGCTVSDDFDNSLGDPAEARLAAALNYIEFNQCPATSNAQTGQTSKSTRLESNSPPLQKPTGIPGMIKQS
jgi:carboxyl-terminal processing protease